jgi:sialic acid synthase SpsE
LPTAYVLHPMPRIVVEIGLNHLGDPARADMLLAAALDTSAHAITFQVREPAFYASGEPYRCRLSLDYYRSARARIKAAGRDFGFAVCDPSWIPEALSIGVDFWKTLSWDLNNYSLQAVIRDTGIPVFVSTGVSALREVQTAVDANPLAYPIQTQLLRDTDKVNLAAIRTIHAATGRPTAFGLHCAELDVTLLALAFDPVAVFFYIREESAPFFFDHVHAVPLLSLTDYVDKIIRLRAAIGDGVKVAFSKPDWIAT